MASPPVGRGPSALHAGRRRGEFSALLDRYRASLYARALAYLGQPEDAADAVQETFLLALTRQD
jgi:RNA polymerase sigma-70 factor, ECF subfamily